MKKKLIAIVASLAMVAAMVPATAFADIANNELAELTDADKTAVAGYTEGGGDVYMDAVNTKGYNDNLTVTKNADGLVLRGALPYLEIAKFSNVKDLQKGHYFAYGINVKGTNPFMVTKAKRMIETKAGLEVQDETTDVTDLTSATGHEQLFYYVTKENRSVKVGDSATAVAAKGKYVSNPNIYADVNLKDIKNWNNIEKDLELTTLTLNVDNLTLLTESETESMDAWMKKINKARTEGTNHGTATKEYARLITYARESYDALSAELKDVIANKVDRYDTPYNYKNAYNYMVDAEKAIKDDSVLDEIKDKIARLKTLPKTGFQDQEEIESYFVPMNEVNKLVDALDSASKADLGTYGTDLEAYNGAYDALIKKYIDPKYAEAAKIDLTKETLEDAELALIRELKAYVEGEYIKTANIANFNQATYDALVAALDKVAKDEASLENATIAAIADQAYTGAAIEPAVTVIDQTGKEVSADDYTVIYSNNKDAGTATVTVAAKSSSAYTGSVSATFTITPAALTDAMVKSVANATYTGKAVTPAVTVDKGVTYEVTYSNNTAVGKATAVITGTGNYSGEITKNFIVKPAKEAISSLKAGKKSLTVAYKAQTGAKYRIVYSPAKGQAKAVNTTATKKTIKSLKAGKTYKVKVRAYKTIDGTTYNGTYSTVKKVKVK